MPSGSSDGISRGWQLQYVPGRAVDMGRAPAAGQWARIELPLDKIGTADKLVDGVGFMHGRGRVEWGRTSIIAPGGEELEAWATRFSSRPIGSSW